MKHRKFELLLDCIPALLGLSLWLCVMGLLAQADFSGTAGDIGIVLLALPPVIIAGLLIGLTLVFVNTRSSTNNKQDQRK